MQHNKNIVLEKKREGDRLEEMESRIDEVVSHNIGVVSWLVEEREIEVLNVKKSMQCNENIVLGRVTKESRQQGVEKKETKSRGNRVVGSSVIAISQLVKEKEIGVLDIWKSIQHNKEVACERTETKKVRQ